MKLICDREKMLSIFQLAAGVVATRTPKEILKNVKLEASADGSVVLMATDMEIDVRVETSGFQVEAPGKVLLPPKIFGGILRESVDQQLTLESDGTKLLVYGQQSQYQLPTENPDEFPSVNRFTGDKFHKVSARFFREMIRRTSFSTDEESSRYALGGVLLELGESTVVAVATDGRRLACQEGPGESVGGHMPEGSTVVPSRSLNLIERALSDVDGDVNISVSDNSITIQSDQTTISSRLVEGRYPRWREILPDEEGMHRIELPVAPLMGAVRQAAIMVDREKPGINFVIGNGRMELVTHGASLGDSRVELPTPYNGEDIVVRLDDGFVMDYLRVLEQDQTFWLQFQDEETAVICKTEDGYTYVIMPFAND